MHTRLDNRSRGASLIEAIIASGIGLLVLVSGANAFVITLRANHLNIVRTEAGFLAEEGIEVARILRDNGWSTKIASLSPGTPYYLAYDYSTNTWSATTTSTSTDTIVRTLTRSTVNRDASQNIVTTGGTPDANTARMTVTVAWPDRAGTSTHSLETYLTNIYSD